jgi:predicted lipoprotein with Yx(FWY)xxD motif
MRTSIKVLMPALAVAALLSACGSSSSGTSNAASSSGQSASGGSSSTTTVKSASNSRLGSTVLVNARGMTLYSLSAERGGKFICTNSACTKIWHPLTVAGGAMPTGSVGSLGVIKRPGGTEQVTYKGMPLYTFAQDQPGQANGQGVKDVGVWTAVSTGSTSTSSASASSSTPASSGGSSYAY